MFGLEKFLKVLDYFYSTLEKKAIELQKDLSHIISDKLEEANKITKNNVTPLINFSDADIMKIINDFQIEGTKLTDDDINQALSNPDYDHSEKRKDVLYKVLQIKYLLSYCSSFNISFDKKQLEALELFIKEYKAILEAEKKKIDIIKIKNSEGVKEKETLSKVSQKYREKSGFIDEFDLIQKKLFFDLEPQFPMDVQKNVLIDIFNHNKDRYDTLMSSINKFSFREKMSENDLDEVLKKYNYSVKSLILSGNNRYYLDLLLAEGNLKRIDEVLGFLAKEFERPNSLPITSKKESIVAFVSVLVNSDIETLKLTFSELEKYGFDKEFALVDPSILFKQSDSNRYKKSPGISGSDSGQLLTGRAIDFSENLKFFSQKGFDMEMFKKKGTSTLTASSSQNKYNYEIMKLYGVSEFVTGNYSKFRNYSCFLSYHMPEVFDSFTELGPEGYQYITRYLSRLKTSDPKHELFYKLKKELRNLNSLTVRRIMSEAYRLIENDDVPKDIYNEKYGAIVPAEEDKYKKIITERLFDRKKKSLSGEIDRSAGNELFDYSILENDIVKQLESKCLVRKNGEKEESFPYIYDIDGVYISKNKFLKIFNILQDKAQEDLKGVIMCSLTFNSIISEDEYKVVSKFVSNLINEKRMG